MADFESLSTIDEKQDADLVADFLVREEKQLSELNDFDGFASEPSTADAQIEESVIGVATESLDLFGQVPAAGNDDNQSAKDVRGMDEDVSRFDRYDALMEDGPPRIETDKIREWQEEQKERLVLKGAFNNSADTELEFHAEAHEQLRVKDLVRNLTRHIWVMHNICDIESEKRQKEWILAALQELEEYQRHREELLGKTKKGNRQAEDVFRKDRDEKKAGGEWERVCRLCDFNPKTGTRATKDVSRLRSLLLQLKQTPNATFAA